RRYPEADMSATRSVVRFGLHGLIWAGIFSAGYVALARTPTDDPLQKAKEPPRVVGITARLDKHEAKPGEVVRLTEVVPAGKDVRVAGQGHSVYYTAYYDRKLGQFVALEPGQYSFRFPEIFHGLPGATILGWNEFTVTNPREKGYEFEIQAKYLGVFLIE